MNVPVSDVLFGGGSSEPIFGEPVLEPVDTLFDFGIDLPVDNEISVEQSPQPYKFSGKEFMTSHGINQYNFGARYYDPALCRFTTMDPLAEKYYSISPYAYCNNNPVIFVDPEGRAVGDYYSQLGEYMGSDGIDDKKLYISLGDDTVYSKENSIEVDGAIFINRYHNNSDSTAGEFKTIGDKSFSGYTMERGFLQCICNSNI